MNFESHQCESSRGFQAESTTVNIVRVDGQRVSILSTFVDRRANFSHNWKNKTMLYWKNVTGNRSNFATGNKLELPLKAAAVQSVFLRPLRNSLNINRYADGCFTRPLWLFYLGTIQWTHVAEYHSQSRQRSFFSVRLNSEMVFDERRMFIKNNSFVNNYQLDSGGISRRNNVVLSKL